MVEAGCKISAQFVGGVRNYIVKKNKFLVEPGEWDPLSDSGPETGCEGVGISLGFLWKSPVWTFCLFVLFPLSSP